MKKAVSILLCLVMVLGLLPMAAFATDVDVTVLVEADKKEGLKPGDTVTYTVSLAPVTKLAAVDFSLAVPAGLELGTVTPAGTLNSILGKEEGTFNGAGFKNLDGFISFAGAGGDISYTSTEKTKLGTFTCTVKADTKGDQTIAFDTEYPPTFGGPANEGSKTYTYALDADIVNVPKTVYVPKTLELTYATATLAIENKDSKPKTSKPVVTGTDRDDDPLPASELAKVEFSIPAGVKGIAVDDEGVVSVTDPALAEAGTVTVTAKLGDVTKTADITVTKAASAATAIKLYKDNVELTADTDTVVIPADDTTKTVTYTGKVLDQYDAVMNDKTVTIDKETAGTTSDAAFEGGVLSLTKTTTLGTVVLKATSDTLNETLTVTVSNITFAGVDAGVVAKDGVYGDKLSDMVKVDGSKITATAGGPVAGTYTLENADSTPDAGDAVAYKVVFTSTDGTYENVTVKEGTVKVAKKEVTVTANDVDVRIGNEIDVTEFTYTVEGLLGEDELTGTATITVDGKPLSATVVSTEEANEYPIAVSGLTASANYAVTFVDGTLSVRKKNLKPIPIGQGTKPDGTIVNPDGTTTKPDDTKVDFTDVADEDWFSGAVDFVVAKGLFKGISETEFAPNTNMNRAMVATVLFRLDGEHKTDVAAAFEDLEADTWYTEGVAWAAEKGVVKGLSETEFAPNNDVTREQLATMLYRYAGEPKVEDADMADFADAETVSDWADAAMGWAVKNGIIKGKDGARLDPQGNATRAEVATMLQRFVDLEK